MFFNTLKKLFTPKATKTALKKGIRRRLELLGLEDRIVPAVPFSPAFPHALSITTGSGAVTTSASFTVTFNQAVIGVDTADFNLIATGTVANGTISSVTGSGATYTVNVTGITGNGTLGLNLVDLPTITALPSFAAKQDFATGNNSISVTLGDVNSDGILDLITANSNSASASVLLGNGNGTFQAKQDFTTGSSPNSVTLGDVNGDGKLDIITANSNSSSASVLLGNGNGTFQAQQTFATGTQPNSVTLGDVNDDGRLDLITANFADDSVSVLLGNGNGTFQTQATFAAGTTPRAMTLGDVNGDGKLDIITANYNSINASVLLGNGDGTFQAQQTFATGTGPQSVTLGDVNADGRLDIITANFGANSVSVLLGNGNGTFQPKVDFTTGSSTFPRSVTLGDVNGDGKLDIITANQGANSASVLLGNGNGTFQPKVDFTTGTGPFSVILGDVNSDGRLDIITANQSSKNISVILGTGGSAIIATFLPQQTFATGNSPSFVTLGDVNSDGKLDIVSANRASNTTSVLLGNGNGTFQNQATFATGTQPRTVTLGDVNGDGNLDIITANISSSFVSVLLGNGNGAFQAQSTFAVGGSFKARFVELGDVNSDGKLDIVTSNGTSNSASVLLGNGDGTFQTSATFATGTNALSMTLGDVNGDGKLDIITGNNVSNDVSVLLGNGNGTFQTQSTFATGTAPGSVTLGDVNGDGRLDIITANQTSNDASVLLGNGNGTFQLKSDFATGTQSNSVTLGDVNGDGKLDILVANIISANASVLLGNGNGTFQTQSTFATGTKTFSATLGDVNGDGRLDIITANYSNANTSVLLNSLAFTGQTATVGSGPSVTSNTSNLAATATTLIITGSGFDTTAANNTVILSSGTGTVISATATQLTITLNTPPSVGNLTAVVTSNGSSSGSPVQVASVVAGPATQATLTTLAAGSASGSAFTTQPIVTIQDALGNTVTNSNASVTMAVSGGDNKATTVGTVTINAVNGVANFSGVGISGTAGTAYTLTFASNGLTSATQSITPTFGAATQATLSTPAAGSSSGSAFTTQPIITIQDAFGNTVTNSTAAVTMTVSGNGSTVGTATINAVAGVATFTNVGISGTAGTPYTLTFASNGLTSATQSITPLGVANTPAFGTPTPTADGFTVQITNYDANFTYGGTATAGGNVAISNTGLVTVSGLAAGTPSTATVTTTRTNYLSGSAPVTASSLNAANIPTFGATTPTADGFTVQITNYNGAFTYGGTATANGTVTISNTGLVTVTGVAAGASSTATITTTKVGFANGSAPVTANALAAKPLITGTPSLPSSSGSSTVNLYNPTTGQPNGTAVPFPGFDGPVKVASGDFNNDGVAELVAGAGFGGGPAIAILNSQTGEILETFFAFSPAFTGGVFVAVQDTNGDGILDIITAAGPGGGPEVRIFNGSNLNVLRSFFAYAEDFSGGVSVASIDFNNDGILDLVTGAGPGGAPHVKVFDGATNAVISQWYAYPVSFTGGVYVAVGDIGNDGTFEVVTGAGPGGAPVVAVWDPFTGALISQFMAYAEVFTGGVRVAINDGNGDGITDLITGAGPTGGPHVKVFSFPDLDILFQFYSGEQSNPGGVFVS